MVKKTCVVLLGILLLGTVLVKKSILNKKGRLTEPEYRQVTFHPEVGERILAPILEDEEILKIVRHHHERYDGGAEIDRCKGTQFDPEVASAFLRIREFTCAVVDIARPRTYGSPRLAGV